MGCRFHAYPYEAQVPVLVDGAYPMNTFYSDKDVWDVVELVRAETVDTNLSGGNFNIAESVMAQLPFFTCKNLFLNKESQKDISRFIYSKDFGISPYQGSYGEQPHKWVAKSFLLKSILERQKSKVVHNGTS